VVIWKGRGGKGSQGSNRGRFELRSLPKINDARRFIWTLKVGAKANDENLPQKNWADDFGNLSKRGKVPRHLLHELRYQVSFAGGNCGLAMPLAEAVRREKGVKRKSGGPRTGVTTP